MKVELIYDLPLVDRLAHRRTLLRALHSLLGPKNIRLHYVGTGVFSYLRAWHHRSSGTTPGKGPLTVHVARQLDIAVRFAGDFYEQPCDLGIVFANTILPAACIDRPRWGTITAHYARLPDLPGREALLWARLLGVAPEISLFRLSSRGIDRGPVLFRRPLPHGTTDRSLAQSAATSALIDLVRWSRDHHRLPLALHPGATGPLLPPLGRRLRERALA